MLLKKKSKLGQSLKCPPSATRKICRFIERGCDIETAASLAGISASRLSEWLHDSPEFVRSIGQAEGRRILRLLFTIRRAAMRGDEGAAKWLLERRFPEEYGKKTGRRTLVPAQRAKPKVEDFIEAIRSALKPGSPTANGD